MLASTVIFLFEENSGKPIGTAFIISYPVDNDSGRFVPLVVTAKHVVSNNERIIGRFTPKLGARPIGCLYNFAELRRNGDAWEHPDEGVDVIVFRTPHFEAAAYRPFPIQLIASRETYVEEDIKETDRIIFPSLLVNFMGTAKNYPVIRDGSIALIPDELVPLEYEIGCRRIRTRQEVILIDATSIPGASGSPIFLWPGPRIKGGAFTLGGIRPFLLGIMHGFYPAVPRELVEIEATEVRRGFMENSGIAICFPSWRLLEIIESDVVTQRIKEILP